MYHPNSRTYPEPRWMTREEVATERANFYRAQEVSRWKNKRRKTHRLLVAARKEIQRLRQAARETR